MVIMCVGDMKIWILNAPCFESRNKSVCTLAAISVNDLKILAVKSDEYSPIACSLIIHSHHLCDIQM